MPSNTFFEVCHHMEIPYKHLQAGKQTDCVFQGQETVGVTISSWQHLFTPNFLHPRFYLQLNMRSSRCSRMDQPDGFLLTQRNSKTTVRLDIESKLLCHVRFLWPDGNISSQWWEKNVCRAGRCLRPNRMDHRNTF